MEKTLILGECKWNPRPMGRKVLRDLVARTAEIVPARGAWRVFYLGFARGSWTEAAHTFAREMSESVTKDGNWETVGMRLLDLDQVDQDLVAWSL